MWPSECVIPSFLLRPTSGACSHCGQDCDEPDEQEFYEVCQSYRHSKDIVPVGPGFPTAAQAFDNLKYYIAEHAAPDLLAEKAARAALNGGR